MADSAAAEAWRLLILLPNALGRDDEAAAAADKLKGSPPRRPQDTFGGGRPYLLLAIRSLLGCCFGGESQR